MRTKRTKKKTAAQKGAELLAEQTGKGFNVTSPAPGVLSITCRHCGKPITRTSARYGMDCEDRCAEKAHKKATKENGGVDPMTAFFRQVGRACGMGDALVREHERFIRRFDGHKKTTK